MKSVLLPNAPRALLFLRETATALNFLVVLGQRYAGLGKFLVFRETVKWGRLSSSLFRVGQHVYVYIVCRLGWSSIKQVFKN